MTDEFDKPLEKADAEESGEDAEVPLVPPLRLHQQNGPPRLTKDGTHTNQSKEEIHTSRSYIHPTLEGMSKAWHGLVIGWIGRTLQSSSFWTAAATVVIAVATVIYTRYAKKQWEEIHSGSTDTHDLAVAAKTQADRTKDLVDAIISGLHFDQRAWVTIEEKDEPCCRKNQGIHTTFMYRNIGKTTAIAPVIRGVSELVKNGEIPDFDFNHFPMHETQWPGNLISKAPPETFTIHWSDGKIFTMPEIGLFNQGLIYSVTFARLDYYDVFGTPHWVQWCGWASTNKIPGLVVTGAKACTQYNQQDKN